MLACGFMIGFLKAGQATVFPVPIRPSQPKINRRAV